MARLKFSLACGTVVKPTGACENSHWNAGCRMTKYVNATPVRKKTTAAMNVGIT